MQQPVLEIEQRIFEMTGLATAAEDADIADDNMSTSGEDQKEEEQLDQAWKKLVFRLNRLPAKAHSKIRQLVVEAISAARKAQQGAVVAQLREALLQYHPDAAGACKSAALEILASHGGYEEDDEDDDENMDDGDDKEEALKPQAQVGLSSVLPFEAMVLSGCLDGKEDARRSDWINAVKRTKTIARLGALVAALCSKASIKLEKMESENDALREAMESWEKASALRKKDSKADVLEPSEVWTNVSFTNEFCLAKVEDYPWWPAKRCIVKDIELAKSLDQVDRAMVSLVGESGGLRVVTKDKMQPFSEDLPEDEDGATLSKELRAQLDDCMAMARRIIRGRAKGGKKPRKVKSPANEQEEFKEEKKLAT